MGRKRVCSLKNIMITVYVGIVILKSFIPFQNLSRLKMVCVFTFTNQTDSNSMNSSHNGKSSIFLNPSIENICDGSLDPLLNSNPLPVPDFTRDLLNFLEDSGPNTNNFNSITLNSEGAQRLPCDSIEENLCHGREKPNNKAPINHHSDSIEFDNFISRLALFFIFELGSSTFVILLFNSMKSNITELIVISSIALVLTYGVGCIIGTLFEILISPFLLNQISFIFHLLVGLYLFATGCLYYLNTSFDITNTLGICKGDDETNEDLLDDSYCTKSKHNKYAIDLSAYVEQVKNSLCPFQSKTVLLACLMLSTSVSRSQISIAAYAASIDQTSVILESMVVTFCCNLIAIYFGSMSLSIADGFRHFGCGLCLLTFAFLL